jgi:hypothetical protein
MTDQQRSVGETVREIYRRHIRRVRTDCGDEGRVERILRETEEHASLAHAGVPDQ